MRKRLILLVLVCLALVFGRFTPAHAENGYTVEFTRDGLEYVLPGDTSVAMSEILSALGLSGEVTAVEISDESLFSASNAAGGWIVTALQPFSTTEWMKVTINGVVYEITVTDDQSVSVTFFKRGWNGSAVTQTSETVSATPVSTSNTWGTTGETWYVVNSDVTISERVTVSGTVNLILCDGCTLTASSGITVAAGNTLNIYGQSGDTGNLIAKGGTSTSGAGIGGGGEVNIYGGTINATGSNKNGRGGAGIGGGSYGAGGVITIYGGDVKATGYLGGAGIGGGGTNTSYNAGSGTRGGDSGTITIYGGTVNATAGDGGAGIGGGKLALNADVTILGGTVIGGGRSGGAGIGTGQSWNKTGDSSCTIVISGNADVTAIGSNGSAGIGSGQGWSSGAGGAYDITIGGSVNVTATGTGNGYHGGAGIGGGSYSRGGTITISGGTVEATGANGGAGIGSGNSGKNATTITIEGGTVTATGSRYGNYYSAAIGHGYNDKTVGDIYLNGGYITTESYGIGGYYNQDKSYSRITINLQDHADAIINAGNYDGIVTIQCPLVNASNNQKVTADNMPTGPSELILGDTTRYEITSFSDKFGNSVTPWSNGIAYSNPLAGDMIDIVVTPGAGYRYKENSLTVKDADNNPVPVVNQRFEMPAKNVTLSAQFEKIPITYIAPDGTTVSNFTDYTPITSELTVWEGDSTPKVFAVLGEVEISKRVTISDNVTLVLTDGAALAPFYGIKVSSGQVLNICGNSTEENVMGTLTIAYTQSMNPGIGGSDSCGSINICGGRISVIGGYDCAGIGGGSNTPGGIINISGGVVTATGGSGGAGIGGGSNGGGGTITISGGHVVAAGKVNTINNGAGAGIGGGSNGGGGTITISGGQIEADGGAGAMGIGGGSGKTDTGSLTVGFSSDDDSLKASSYTALTVEAGKNLADSDGASYAGVLSDDALEAIQNKTLVMAYSISVNVIGEGGTVTPSASAAPKNSRVTLDVSPADGYALQTLSYQAEGSSDSVDIVKDNDGKYSFEMPQGNVTVTATFALHVHHFTYTAAGSTITAACTDGCGITTGLTLTISAPTDLTYNGQNKAATLSTGYNTTAFPGTYTIVYTKNGQAFAATPTDVGEYTAGVTVGEGNGAATASVKYTIAQANPTAIAPAGLTATYGQTLANVSLEGKNPEGNTPGTWAWVDSTQSVGDVVTPAAAFKATFTPNSSNYKTVENVDVSVTVSKADPTAPTGLTATYGQTLADVTLPNGWTWSDNTQSVGNVVSPAATFKANFAGDNNHNAATNVDVAVTVNKAEPATPTGLTATYGQTLADVTLPDGWTWSDSAQSVGNVVSQAATFKANFAGDDNHNAASNVDVAVTVSKADQTAPAAPTKASATINSITLTAIENGEYKMDSGEWQASPEFTGLAMSTAYTFYQRIAGDANHNASPASQPATISTNDHAHNWSYQASGAVITATCGNSDGGHTGERTATLTINAPALNVYGGSGSAEATITGSIEGVTNPDIVYKKGSETLNAAPTNAGTYTASITLGGAAASVEYTINPATLTGVSVTQNGTLTYTGSAQTPQVTTTATAVNDQVVTFTYSKTQDGEYSSAVPTVTDVSDSGSFYFKASAPNHGDAAGSFTVTVEKADQTAPAAPTQASATINSITLTAIENGEYKMDSGEWQASPEFTGLAMSTAYTFYQRIADDANHNASPASQPATISTNNHVHNWSYQASGAVITANCGNSDGGHTGERTATLTINAPALNVYGGSGSAEATITGSIEGVTNPDIVYKKGSETLNAAPTNAGTYTASITLGGATASVEYTIAQATTTITDNPTAGDITYGKTLANSNLTGGTASVAGSFAWKDSTIAPAVSDSQKMEYDVVFTPTDGNYGTAECKVKLTVNKADSAVTKAPEAKTLTYTGQAQNLMTAGAAEGGEMQYAIGDNADTAPTSGWNKSIPTATNTGTYYVWYKVVGDTNHNDTQAAKVTVTVSKATVTAPTIASKSYTGETQTADVAASTLYSVTTNNGGTNVGSYNVVLTLTDSANYKWTDSTKAAKTLKFQITKATAPTIAVPTPSAVTYDPAKTLADISLPNGWAWVTSTTVPTVGNSGYAAALTVDDANYNYSSVQGYNATTRKVTRTVSLTVNKATVTAPTIASKSYTGETQTADVAASTLYSVTTNNGGTNVGSYDVVLTLTDSANYKWTDSTEAAKTLSFRITKATANTVTVSIEGWTYGEAAKAPTSTATFGTAAYTYAVKGSNTFTAKVPTNAGEYTVKAAVAGTADYPAGEATTDFTIARASITPTVSITGWTVGETANTPGVAGNTGDGAVTYSYAVKGSTQFTAKVPTDAGEYTVKASIAATDNYNGAEATADFTIAKKTPVAGVDFSVEALQLTYTGTRKELVRQTILTDGLEIQYSFDNGVSVEDGLPMKKASGVYQIYYRVIGNDVYETLNWAGPVTATITMYAVFSAPDFTLPAFLAEIGEEAFAEDTAITTMDAGSCAKIDANAFRGCTNLKKIRLSQNCEIDDTAFTGCMALKIFAPAGGTTAAWCASHNINFVAE